MLRVNQRAQSHPHFAPLAVLFGTWGTFFLSVFLRMAHFTREGFSVGHVNVWSDWSLHIGMINIFATKSPADWFAYHPMYASGKFTYGFLTNFISAMLVRLGFGLVPSLILPSLLFIFAFLLGAYCLFFLLTKSKWAAVLAISFFFLSSGMGFVNFVRDFQKSPTVESIVYPPELYSRFDQYDWYSGNVIVGMLVPQRAFLLGITLATWAFTLFVYGLLRPKNWSHREQMRVAILGGVLAGLLPISHMHSFLVLIVLCAPIGLLLLRSRARFILTFAAAAGLVSIPLYLIFISGGIENPDFFSILIGWTAKGGLRGWIVQWAWQWGLMLPIASLGTVLAWKKLGWKRTIIFSSFWLVFIIGNTILLQPIRWDNAKFFLWAYLGFSGLAAFVLTEYWKTTVLNKGLVVLATFLLVATGSLELIRFHNIARNELQTTSTEDIALGIKLRQETDPRAVFLTTPSHNHFVMMWGARPVVMGYTAWVWNFGFLYDETERDVRRIYLGTAETEDLLRKHNVSYVVVGPGEIYDLKANETYFADHYPVRFSNRNYRIYDVRNGQTVTVTKPSSSMKTK